MVINKLLPHLPTVLAGGLLVSTLGYHIAHAGTIPAKSAAIPTGSEVKTKTSSIPELAKNELQLLLSKPVFGQVAQRKSPTKPKAVATQSKVIPKTRLQLKLNGVVAKDDELLGHAIIDNKEYRVGETIEANTSLQAVYSDRVVLKHNNKLEVLPLPGTDTSSNSRLSNARNSLSRKNLAKRALKKQQPK